ncbi:MAG: hypothetical protein H7Z37_14740 [Pyrinomonadaceae bacterium]|nr:hypothetical protein [Pyrinomonadaceae bacterium]
MDDEKLQRTIDFIVNNQAQFTIDIQKLQETQKESEKRFSTLERVSMNLYNATSELIKNGDELRKSHEEMRKTHEQLIENQKETNERLNIVIMMMERYFSGENGKSKKD